MTTEHDEQQEEAAFAEAFDATEAEPAGDDVGAPAPAPAPAHSDGTSASAPAPAADKQEPAEPAQDPFAGLPDQVKNLLAEIPTLRQTASEAMQIARREAGRVASLQSRLDKLQPSAPAPAPAQAHRFEKLEALRQDLPEIADALDEVVSSIAPRKDPSTEPATAGAPAPAPVAPPQDARTPQEEALDEVRPGWDEQLVSSDFQLWLTQQPPEYRQKVAMAQRAGEILSALKQHDAYRAQLHTTRQIDAGRQTRMAAAVVPQGDRRPPSRNQPLDDEEAAFEAAFNGRSS